MASPRRLQKGAINGREAVDAVEDGLASNNPFALIFMDIMMPALNGLEAAETIRGLEKMHEVAL
ncbi:MAG: hypothetical protein ABIL62_11095 [Planctomycetota bacterium]